MGFHRIPIGRLYLDYNSLSLLVVHQPDIRAAPFALPASPAFKFYGLVFFALPL